MIDTDNGAPDHQNAYVVVGIVAAAVSAAVAAYVFYSRSRDLGPHAESVQDLLERCHTQVREIEQRLADLHPPVNPNPTMASQ